MVLPHPPKHLEPPLAQATQCTGMVMAPGAFSLVIGLGPAASFAAFIDPQVNRMAQEVIANKAQACFAEPPGLIWCRADARLAHQTVGIGKNLALGANETQQPRSQRLFGSGQGTKDVVIRVPREGFGDP